jgi:hypothetical protein
MRIELLDSAEKDLIDGSSLMNINRKVSEIIFSTPSFLI